MGLIQRKGRRSKKMVELSERQQAVLTFIAEFIIKHKYAPSNREIGVGVSLSSPSTVQHHLDELRDKGFITWRKGEVRTIQIIVKEEVSMKGEVSQAPDMMLMDAHALEHLLNCMANKNFIHEQTEEVQKEWQNVYDTAWNEGMLLLSQHRQNKTQAIKAKWGGHEFVIGYASQHIKYPTPDSNIFELGAVSPVMPTGWRPYEPQIIEVKFNNGSSITLSGVNGNYSSINPVKVEFVDDLQGNEVEELQKKIFEKLGIPAEGLEVDYHPEKSQNDNEVLQEAGDWDHQDVPIYRSVYKTKN
jgi:DNA-binding transcriptional regulator YhcF (GntR family)